MSMIHRQIDGQTDKIATAITALTCTVSFCTDSTHIISYSFITIVELIYAIILDIVELENTAVPEQLKVINYHTNIQGTNYYILYIINIHGFKDTPVLLLLLRVFV